MCACDVAGVCEFFHQTPARERNKICAPLVCVCVECFFCWSQVFFSCDVVESESSLMHKLGCSYFSLKSGKESKMNFCSDICVERFIRLVSSLFTCDDVVGSEIKLRLEHAVGMC